MPVFFLWSYVHDHLRYIHNMLSEKQCKHELFLIAICPARRFNAVPTCTTVVDTL